MKATRSANGLSYTHTTIEERLAAGLVRMPNGCLEWIGCANVNGYGRIWFNGRRVKTHRLAWGLAHPDEPLPPVVRHFICDNPPCCDVTHLRPGTRADNAADMASKGRVRNGKELVTHCPQNHPYDEANTYVRPNGGRDCRTCETSRRANRHRVYLYEPVECPDCGKSLGANNLAVHAKRFHL
jgi:hypothetical protein